MKSLASNVLAYRQARLGEDAHLLVYVTAKNRSTGDPESIGFWTGMDHEVFSINSEGRTYYGAGDLLAADDLTSEAEMVVRQTTVSLSQVSAETIQAISGYDIRFAPIEMHRAEFDLDTGNLLAEPQRIFKGWVDTVDKTIPSQGGTDGAVVLTCVSNARALTRTLTLKFSDASQKLVNASDDMLKYSAVSGSVDVWWGSRRVSASEVATTTKGVPERSVRKLVGKL